MSPPLGLWRGTLCYPREEIFICLTSTAQTSSYQLSVWPCRWHNAQTLQSTNQAGREEAVVSCRVSLPRAAGYRHQTQSRGSFARERVAGLIYFLSSDPENKALLFPLIRPCLGLVDCVSCLAADRERNYSRQTPGCAAVALTHGPEVLIKKVEERRFFFLSARP